MRHGQKNQNSYQFLFLGIIAGFSLFLGCLPAAALVWTTIGHGGGGAMFVPRISPLDPNLLSISCDMGGWYLSVDGGQHWQMKDMGSGVPEVVFSDRNVNTIYACGQYVWKSTDKGQSWVALTGAAIQGPWATPGAASMTPQALAVDRDNENQMWVAIAYGGLEPQTNDFRGFYASANGGQTWTKAGTGLPESTSISPIFIDYNTPVGNRILYVGTTGGVFKSANNGATFTTANTGLPGTTIFDLGVGSDTAAGTTILYATIPASGIYKSTNGGAGWTRLTAAPSNPQHVAVCRDFPNNVYIIQNRANVYKTTNGGANWTSVVSNGSNCGLDWKTEAVGFSYQKNMEGVAVSPTNPQVALWSDFFRLDRSTDGGSSWTPVFTEHRGASWGSRGLEVTTCYGYYIDPQNRARRYLAYTDNGFFRSVDSGQTWIYANSSSNWNTFYGMAFDPANTTKLYAVTGSRHDIPIPRALAGTGSGEFLVSTNAGVSWSNPSSGLPNTMLTMVTVDPSSPAASRTLYVAAWHNGVYKSTNGGATWTAKNNGLTSLNVWRIYLRPNGNLYAVVVRDTTIDGGVYRSADGGDSWTKLTSPIPWKEPLDIAFHPTDANVIYVANRTREWPIFDVGAPGAIWRSLNGGATWAMVMPIHYPFGLTVDAREPDLVYATACEDNGAQQHTGIYVSHDRGSTWQKLPDLPARAVFRVTIDSLDLNRLYAVTFGYGALTTTLASSNRVQDPALGSGVGAILVSPNPANPRTLIQYQIPEAGLAQAGIFDAGGRRVRQVFQGILRAGWHSWEWDGRADQNLPVSTGEYFFRVQTRTGKILATKMLLIR